MQHIAALFGVTTEGRTTVVREMLDKHLADRSAYWLALGLSTCIATLGLVLDSPGVVIGAMLISPLMGPIVELGMGLAIGSPLLVVRAFTRALASVAFVVIVAAIITIVLPYHEITGELAARTSPTVLDLSVAVCCAVAAVYATTLSAKAAGIASGTAIGIALVPPICACGYGLGSANTSVATGAILLFVANFSAIVLVSLLSFLLLRFDKVDVHGLEAARMEASERTSRAGRWLHKVFATRYGRALRVLMPVVMAAAVFVPLRRAMQELSWEIRVRTSVSALLRTSPETRHAIHTSIKIDNHAVRIDVAIVGTAEDGARLEELLQARVQDVAGLRPSVTVLAVAGAANIQRLESSLARAAPMTAGRRSEIADVRSAIGLALKRAWPDGEVGTLLDWQLRLPPAGDPALEVFHLGEPLGGAAERLLASALDVRLDPALRVHDVAYSPRPYVAELDAPGPWIAPLRDALDAIREHPLVACVAVPSLEADAGAIGADAAEVERLLGAARADRLVVRRGGKRWSVVLTPSSCVDTADSGAELEASSDAARGGAGGDRGVAPLRPDGGPDAGPEGL